VDGFCGLSLGVNHLNQVRCGRVAQDPIVKKKDVKKDLKIR
jgi:hypothetical protein